MDPDILSYATDRQREYISATIEHGSMRAAAKVFGVEESTVRRAITSATAKLAQARRQEAIAPKGTAGFIARELTTAYDGDGNVLGEWLREGPEPPFTYGGEDEGAARDGTDPYFIKGISTYFDASGAQRGQWVKTSIDQERRWEIIRAHLDAAKEEIAPVAPITAPTDCDVDLCTIYPVGDPHAGLYSWKEETGAHFDLAEFERIQKGAIDRLVQSTPRSALAIFNDKGDATHADNSKNRTPRSGHELDVHGRHGEVVRVSVRVKRYQIARLLEKHEKVIVRVDPGNHDPESALHLALVLEALYENEPRVEVITSPNPYWYYLFGSNLIGTCHGDGAKGKDLPGIMAHDAREWWGQADYCVWFVGHVHHKDAKDYTGCTVEYLRTLAAADAWSHGAGHRARRSLEAVTLHKEDAEVERHTCSLRRIERLLAA